MQLLSQALGLGEADLAFEAANVFQYDFAEAFWFGNLPDGGRAFLHEAASAEAATELFAALVEELSYDYEALDVSAERAVMKHNFLGTYFVVTRVGRYLTGADNLSKATAVTPLVAKLESALTR